MVAMGKVVINEHDATQTASKNSSSDQPSQKSSQQSQVKISRFHKVEPNVGVKMNSKPKNAAKAQPVARVNGRDVFGLPEGKDEAGAKSPRKIMTEAKIVERTQVRVVDAKASRAEALNVKKPGSKFDPELALLANRTSTAERSRVDMSRAGKSMSGMIGGAARRPGAAHAQAAGRAASAAGTAGNSQANLATSGAKTPKEEDLRFTKFKSVLIGVGAAVVVAVIGFAAIGIFGSKKNMCTVLFESNGGSKVAGTEIVCGRTVKRPDDPTKEGFSFEGWSFEGEDFDFANTALYKNATLVARWKADDNTEIVKVTLDPNGGSINMTELEVAKGKKLDPNSLSTPSQPGYVFEDWYLGDKPYDFEQPVEADMTLRAEWSKQQTNTDNNGNNNNNGNGGNNSEPLPAKAASIETAGDLTIEIGKSTTMNVNVLPSAANYNLVANSSDENRVSCVVAAKTAITCTAKEAGEVTVRVRDTISGVSAQFKVTVPANDVPPVNPGDDNPPISGGDDNGGNGDNSGDSGNSGSGNTGGSGDSGSGTGNEGGDTGNTGDNSGGA